MSMAAPVLPPPLRAGDRLTSDEFIRRWDAMPDLKRAELIDGIVYMPSPLSLNHGDFQSALGAWLGYYEARTPGCRAGSESTWIMGNKDVPQPDVTVRILPDHGGQSRVDAKYGKYGSGAPELIVEVIVSSRHRDVGAKLRTYERTGVLEYVTAHVPKREIEWRLLVDGKYRKFEPSASIYRSQVFPGLWLDEAALWRRDLAALIALVDKGTGTREHAAFVRRLKK